MSKQEMSSGGSNLTQSQLLFWTGQKLSPDAPLYNMVLTFEIQGVLDVSRFRLAFQHLIDQSDALRTIFTEEEGIPQQRVISDLGYDLEVLDWSKTNMSLAEEESWFSTKNSVKFDLSKRLFDAVLIKKSGDHWIWYLNQHHLITDAWAVSVLYRKMAELYKRLGEGLQTEATPLPSFQNYIAYERETRLANKSEKAGAYWEDIASKLPSPPKL